MMRGDNLIILKCLTGSHAYGLATPSSDHDYRGVYIPFDPMDVFDLKMNLSKVDTITHKDTDTVYWDIRKYVHMAMKGNTIPLELLFVEQSNVVYSDTNGDLLRSMRKQFLSKKIIPVMRGYSYSEYGIALGFKKGSLGNVRKRHIQDIGYSPKNASHCLRLLWCGANILLDQEYHVYIDNENVRDEIMAVKMGDTSKGEFERLYKHYNDYFEDAIKRTSLPEFPNSDMIYKFLINCFKEIVLRGNES